MRNLLCQNLEKKPIIIEAERWFKNGDHPEDNCKYIDGSDTPFDEGNIVRYFRRPKTSGTTKCGYCGTVMHLHGWIDTPEDGHIVCPGDWIIRGIKGEYYPCKPNIFEETYELVTEI